MSVADWKPPYFEGSRVYCRHWPRDYIGRVKRLTKECWRDHDVWVAEVEFPRHPNVRFAAECFLPN